MNSAPDIDSSWTLFLDRDGVINRRLPGDYVKEWTEFEFLPGVLDALAELTSRFGRILIVTNQQGIGKGWMTEVQLHQVHRRMREAVERAGGRIDRIYYCPDLASTIPNCRKPAPAMALAAQEDFPAIDFERSVMVGDSLSDMEFGAALGMQTVLIETKQEALEKLSNMSHPVQVHYRFPSLEAFRRALSRNQESESGD